nr:type III-B CRISPR module RAMP protein Cmr1 [uncultured Undibacterium sp.]
MKTFPSLDACSDILQAVKAKENQPDAITLAYEVTLITYMMGGGVIAGAPDDKMPFRTKSLRGHLRHWWRVLARGKKLSLNGTAMPETPDGWRSLEFSIWGGVQKESVHASRIGLHIDKIEKLSIEQYEKTNPTATRQHWGALAYALFPAKAPQGQTLGLNLVRPGAKLRLTVTLKDKELKNDVEQVIKFWATYGGFGARTTRGLGAVRVHQIIDGKPDPKPLCALPPAWIEPHIKSAQGWANDRQNMLARPAENNPLVFRPLDTIMTVCLQAIAATPTIRYASLALNANESHKAMIEKFQAFRQRVNLARNAGTNRPGRSYWPEGDAMRAKSAHYSPRHTPRSSVVPDHLPRADFGLPIILDFLIDGPGNNATRDVRDRDPLKRSLMPLIHDRMSSPLILRPVAFGIMNEKGETSIFYLAVATVINRVQLGESFGGARSRYALTSVRIDPPAGTTKELPVWSQTWEAAATDSPAHRYRSGKVFNDTKLKPESAVDAFLNYFTSGDA